MSMPRRASAEFSPARVPPRCVESDSDDARSEIFAPPRGRFDFAVEDREARRRIAERAGHKNIVARRARGPAASHHGGLAEQRDGYREGDLTRVTFPPTTSVSYFAAIFFIPRYRRSKKFARRARRAPEIDYARARLSAHRGDIAQDLPRATSHRASPAFPMRGENARPRPSSR